VRILVTGASGFIGGYVVKQLARNSTYSIIATGRSQTSLFEDITNVDYFQADLSKRVKNVSCDVCIHCAGLADDNSTEEEFEQSNVLATELLLRTIKSCKTIIHISSSSVYDFSKEEVKTENDAELDSNLSLYGISKLKSEGLIRKSGIPSIYILRPRAVYGPGDRILLPRILKLIKKSIIMAPGSFKVRTSLTHVQNLYEAIEKSLIQSKRGIQIFNIADSCVYNLRDVVGQIAYHKYQHKNHLHIPIWFIRWIIFLSSTLRIRLPITNQSLNYISQNSVLSTHAAKHSIDYQGNCIFFESIDQLGINSNISTIMDTNL
jgi:2-alkyl-3-oxoalkanoate reductase